jgi:hypothetical protein
VTPVMIRDIVKRAKCAEEADMDNIVGKKTEPCGRSQPDRHPLWCCGYSPTIRPAGVIRDH